MCWRAPYDRGHGRRDARARPTARPVRWSGPRAPGRRRSSASRCATACRSSPAPPPKRPRLSTVSVFVPELLDPVLDGLRGSVADREQDDRPPRRRSARRAPSGPSGACSRRCPAERRCAGCSRHAHGGAAGSAGSGLVASGSSSRRRSGRRAAGSTAPRARGDLLLVGDHHDGSARRVEPAKMSMTRPWTLSRLPVGSSARTSAGSRDERAGHRDALLLAAGELARHVLRRGRRARPPRAQPRPARAARVGSTPA